MKKIIIFLLFALVSFVGAETAKAVIVFDQDGIYIDQSPGQSAKQITTMYAGDTYTFYMSTSAAWSISTVPPGGLSFSVNGGPFTPNSVSGSSPMFGAVQVKADDNALDDYAVNVTVYGANNLKYEYSILVRAKPHKFSCVTTTVEGVPGSTKPIPNVVELITGDSPLVLTPGKELGSADNGNIKIIYGGVFAQMYPAGTTTKIPVILNIGTLAQVGTHDLVLDGMPNVAAECAWKIIVNAPVCDFQLDCNNPIINPNDFKEGVLANSIVKINYTLSGCPSYDFAGISNIKSTGVEGLVLNIPNQTVTKATGQISAIITGTPTSSGKATFSIPNYCSFEVDVAKGDCVFALDCSNPVITPDKFVKGTAANSSVSIKYTLTGCSAYNFAGVTNVQSTGVTGLVLKLDAKNIASASGTVSGTITGTPTSAGKATFNIPNYCTIEVTVTEPACVLDLDCVNAVITPNDFKKGTAANSTVSIKYTLSGCTSYNFAGVTSISSVGVLGLVMKLDPKTINTATGTITGTITGTPTSTGIASFTIPGHCTVSVCVTEPVCVFSLDCSNPVVTPNDFKKGTAANSAVSMNYTLSGCTSYNFAGATNIQSTGVQGLVLKLDPKTINTASGTVSGTITGTPTSAGFATFNIPGFCSFYVCVTEPVCVFSLDCSNVVLSPNDFEKGTSAYVAVSMKYTLSGCTSYNFPGIYNIQSTGVQGLNLSLDAKTINTTAGTVSGVISGTPTSAGYATFNIPGYCSFTVNVKDKQAPINVICGKVQTIQVKLKNPVNAPMRINYTLASGSTTVNEWTSVTKNGVYVYVPQQTVYSPSGIVQYYVKGTPDKTGTVSLPININGTECCVNVKIINTCGSCCSHGVLKTCGSYCGSTGHH